MKPLSGPAPTPYPEPVVRDVLIEAVVRGFRLCGNEFCIINGQFYAARNGLRRRVMTWPGVTELKDTYEAPRLVPDKGTLVKCQATWKRDEIADGLECEFPIRDHGLGPDAVLAQAERRLMKRIHDRLSGTCMPEADMGDENPEIVLLPTVTPDPGAGKRLFSGQAPARTAEPHLPAANHIAELTSEQKELAEYLQRNGVLFPDFIHYLAATGICPTANDWPSVFQVPGTVAASLLADQHLLRSIATIWGKPARDNPKAEVPA